MEEKRSWASSGSAKKPHAIFECLSHNFMLLIEDEVAVKKFEGQQRKKLTSIQHSRELLNERNDLVPSYTKEFTGVELEPD